MQRFRRFTAAVLTVAALAGAIVSLNGSAMAQAQKDAAPAAAPAPAPSQAPAPQPIKQIALTDQQVASLIATQTAMDAITDKLQEGAADKPDPKLQAQLEDVAKKNGFASFDDYANVYDNIGLVMSGIDPKTKVFTQPPELLKKQIAELTADKTVPAKEKTAMLNDMKAAQASVVPVQFTANVALVTKSYDKLMPLFSDDE